MELRRDHLLWYARFVQTSGKSIWLPTAFWAEAPFRQVADELGQRNPGYSIICYQGAAA
jgi:hypothetical protein